MVDGSNSPPAPSAPRGNAGWHPDPAGRFELRYHNGQAWTADVSTDGERFVDPAGTAPAPRHDSTPNQHPNPNQPPAAAGRNPVATASMVLGIAAIALGWMPFVVALAIIAAVLAIVFGVVGRRRSRSAGVGGGFALTGLITGAVGLLVCIGGVLFSIALLDAVDDFEHPAAHEAEITACDRIGDEVTAIGTLTNVSDTTASYTVRVYFVRTGTDNPRRQATVVIDDLGPGDSETFTATRGADDVELDCTIGAVRGPLPYGVDPGT